LSRSAPTRCCSLERVSLRVLLALARHRRHASGGARQFPRRRRFAVGAPDDDGLHLRAGRPAAIYYAFKRYMVAGLTAGAGEIVAASSALQESPSSQESLAPRQGRAPAPPDRPDRPHAVVRIDAADRGKRRIADPERRPNSQMPIAGSPPWRSARHEFRAARNRKNSGQQHDRRDAFQHAAEHVKATIDTTMRSTAPGSAAIAAARSREKPRLPSAPTPSGRRRR